MKHALAGLVGVSLLATTALAQEGPAAALSRPADAALAAACPEGKTLRITDATTATSLDIACRDLATAIKVEPALRGIFLDLFEARQTTAPRPDEGGERLGESAERWSPMGWFCDVIAASVVGYGCYRSHIDWRACVAIGATPGLACALI